MKLQERLQGIDPIWWPAQLAGAVAIFATFLFIILMTFLTVAAYELIWHT